MEKQQNSTNLSINLSLVTLTDEEFHSIDEGSFHNSINEEKESLRSIEVEIQNYTDDDESACSSRSNSIVTFDSNQEVIYNENLPKRNSIVTWIDSIYELFQEEPEENKVEGFDDNVTYEESEIRIIYISSILALFFALISMIMTGIVLAQSGQSQVLVVNHAPLKVKVESKSHPYVVIWFPNGQLEFLKLLDNLTLENAWDFKAPQSQRKCNENAGYIFCPQFDKLFSGHIIYSQLGKVFILYTNGQKDITVITVLKQSESELTHSRLPDSKVPKIMPPYFYYNPRFVQLGTHQFWIFNGKSNGTKHEEQEVRKSAGSLIWNTRKHVYYLGPSLPKAILGNGYPISLNRTTVLVLVIDEQSHCIQAYLYSFLSFVWTLKTECIYQISHPFELTNDMKGTFYFDKNAKLKILVMYNINPNTYLSEEIGINQHEPDLEILLIDWESLTVEKVNFITGCNYVNINYPTSKLTFVT